MECPFCYLIIGDKVEACPYCRMPISESTVAQVTPSAQWKCLQCGSKDIYYDLGFIYKLHLPKKHLKNIVPRCVHCHNMGEYQSLYSFPANDVEENISIGERIVDFIVCAVMLVIVMAIVYVVFKIMLWLG